MTRTWRPRARTWRNTASNLAAMVDVLEQKQEDTGVKLLWGTANLFSHPRYAAGAATNPDPEVFAYAATQVFSAMNATQQLGGANYVLWGGREGYDTLLNTDLQTRAPATSAVSCRWWSSHKHKIGFKGNILIEPKPHGADQAPVRLRHRHRVRLPARQFGLEHEVKAEHRGQPRHARRSQLRARDRAWPLALGIFGSIDANRGDPQNGWDTDQFPNSVEDLTLALYEILQAGRIRHRWLQLRCQGAAPEHRPDRPRARPRRRHRRTGAGVEERGPADRAGRAGAVHASSATPDGRRNWASACSTGR